MRYIFFVLAIGIAGCSKSDNTSTTAAPKNGPPMGGMPGGMPGPGASIVDKLPGGPEFAAGKKVYSDNNCARCHKLGETGGGMAMGGPAGGGPGGPPGGGFKGGPPGGGMSGPDLSKTGADANHTAAWLAAHIRDPRSHSPQSRMPASGPDKISDADLNSLAEYLASQK